MPKVSLPTDTRFSMPSTRRCSVTAEARRLHAEADRLQDENETLADEARERGLPELPPIPVPVAV